MNKIILKKYTAYTTANLATTCNLNEAIRRKNECAVRSLDGNGDYGPMLHVP